MRYDSSVGKKHLLIVFFAKLFAALLAFGPVHAQAVSGTDATALDVYTEVCRIAGECELWPGYDARNYPLAIYDGEHTYLFNHPSPPQGFRPVEGAADIFVFAGRHETMRANTGLQINGVQTATVLLSALRSNSRRAIAAIAIHEAFHVYQLNEHRDWPWPNEVAMLVYPADDLELLRLRRRETEAFRRAIEADSSEDMTAWTVAALEIRSKRFALLPDDVVEYERGIELIEGTAHYVQSLAEDNPEMLGISETGYAADGVRGRAYATGNAMGELLDRLGAGWKETLNDDPRYLDEMLRDILSTRQVVPVEFTLKEEAALAAQAGELAAKLAERRRSLRELFDGQAGTSVVVQIEGEPLFPRAFDPMNILVLSDAEVLHLRFLRMGNSTGSLEVLDRMALTVTRGNHPLFEGIHMLTVRGLSEPEVEKEGGSVTVQAENFTAEFRDARIERKNGEILITVSPTGARD